MSSGTVLITEEQAIRHLGLEGLFDSGDEMEAELLQKMEDASAIIIDYLKYEETGWDDPANVPRPIRAATLIVLANLWDDKDGTGQGDYLAENGAVARLLRRYRDPAMA